MPSPPHSASRGLLLLYGLLFKGRVRRMFRGLGRPKNFLLFLVGVSAFAGYVALVCFGGAAFRVEASAIRLYGPPAMALFFLLSALGSLNYPGIPFLPAEIELLFPAPVSRRALLLYKVLSAATALVVAAGFMALTFTWLSVNLANAFAASVIFMLLLGLGSQIVSLALAGTHERLRARVGRAALLVAVLALTGGAIITVNQAPNLPADVLRAALESVPGRVALFPFGIVTEILLAGTAPGLLAWTGAGTLLVVLALWVLIRLDVDYREASIAASQRVQEMMDRMRRKGSVFAAERSRGKGVKLRMFPRWGGAGPLFWRQATSLLHNARAIALVVLGALVIIVLAYHSATEGEWAPLEATLTLTFFSTFVLGMMLQYDFRGDLGAVEILRTLPIRPAAVAAGQILAPTAFISLIQWVALTVLVVLRPDLWPWLLAAGLAAPLLNAVLIGMENLAFLVYPVRMTPGTAFDFQHMGRSLLMGAVKYIAVSIIGGAAFAAGAAAYVLTGRSILAGGVAASTVLTAAVVSVTYLVSRAFLAFDVSSDLPA